MDSSLALGLWLAVLGSGLTGADLRLLLGGLLSLLPLGCISLRIQTTLRYSLAMGSQVDRAVNVRLTWRWLFSRLLGRAPSP